MFSHSVVTLLRLSLSLKPLTLNQVTFPVKPVFVEGIYPGNT